MADIHLYFVGIPLLLTVVLAVLVYARKGAHPPTYDMSQPWTHPPVLWAAVDEVIAGHDEHGAGFSVGGGASGKW